jgi:hypothetical protein
MDALVREASLGRTRAKPRATAMPPAAARRAKNRIFRAMGIALWEQLYAAMLPEIAG